VLLVDDDLELCDLVKEYLRQEAFVVEAVHDGKRGIERALSGQHAVIVLDVMLPSVNGLDLLRQIRTESTTPVLMLSARGEDIDRILGLEIGADDYLSKPFNPRELVARIRAILRRARSPSGELSWTAQVPERTYFDDIELDKGARIARRADQDLALTTAEFNLLEVFLRAPGRIISRQDLAKEVLGRDFSPFDRSIDVHVSNLRKKLGPRPDGNERIRAARGVGYLFTFPANPKRKQESDRKP
jgi:two-component system response regulator CpxR